MNCRTITGLITALAFSLISMPSHAVLINLDLIGGGDNFTTGAAVFGNAGSQWNLVNRGSNPTNLALSDDTGAATGFSVSWSRLASGGSAPGLSGAFSDLGSSHIMVAVGTDVTISGFTPGTAVDLVVFDETNNPNWSTLVAGSHYLLSQGLVANGSGEISFFPHGKHFGSGSAGFSFSAFQFQTSATTPVPEPTTLALLALGLVGLAARRRQIR